MRTKFSALFSLVIATSIADALNIESIFRRQADESSCTSCQTFLTTIQNCGQSLSCLCTDAVDTQAQTCVNCLVGTTISPAVIQNITTEYNNDCRVENIAVITIPAGAGSIGGPTGAGTALPSATGFETSPDGFSSAPFATPTGDVSGSSPDDLSSAAFATPTGDASGTDDSPPPVPETTLSLDGSPNASPTGLGSNAGSGNTGAGNSGQSGGGQTGQAGKTSGGSRSKHPRETKLIESIVVAMSAVVFFG
ncbi:hypothetical protein D9619_008502 [Psilocybe cf. subviscida]|uniref:Extracellular membrane protein CFEM domain-containing protein n=1 Tax=Psilocybe cf. subviscida TaxID=2480587 RepID=A0A8H5BC20_9AGAR|nr:hypothetical protein D9619_008502 [Psilocybe cf. subviscida]